MTRRLKLGGAGALVLLLVLAATWTVRRLDGEDRAVAVTGTIEALQVDVSAKITARIVERTVAESQPVERGQLLVRLADAEPAAEVRRAEAAVRTAQAQLSDLAAGARSNAQQRKVAGAAAKVANENQLVVVECRFVVVGGRDRLQFEIHRFVAGFLKGYL